MYSLCCGTKKTKPLSRYNDDHKYRRRRRRRWRDKRGRDIFGRSFRKRAPPRQCERVRFVWKFTISNFQINTHTHTPDVRECRRRRCRSVHVQPTRARLRAGGEVSEMGGGRATVYGGFYITSCHIFFGLSRRRRQLVYADAESVTFFFLHGFYYYFTYSTGASF